MIQRIQSLYLLAVTIAAVVMMSAPIGHFVTPSKQIFEMGTLLIADAAGNPVNYEPWPLFVLLQAVAILSLVTIFLFKNRLLQIRLTVISTVLLLVYCLAAFTYVFTLKGESVFVPAWTVCLPPIGIILNWMAIRGIRKDDNLVKSYDRLR